MVTRRRRAVPKGQKSKKTELQMALEYIISYGWMLLIVAALIFFFFYMDGSINLNPKAAPGSCMVVRYGTGASGSANLEGVCKNYAPQTASNFGTLIASGYNSSEGKGKGKISYPSYVIVSSPINFYAPQSWQDPGFTLSAWVYWFGPSNTNCQGIFNTMPGPSSGIGLFGYGGNNGACGPLWVNGSYVKWPKANNYTLVSANAWEFVVAEYNQATGNATVFVDNKVFSNSTVTPRPFTSVNATTIGADIWPSNAVYPFNGYVTNVQLYNTPLGMNYLDQMYMAGLGGDPIALQNLVGWWPLNGDTADYSGYGNGGTAVNITYSGGYPAP